MKPVRLTVSDGTATLTLDAPRRRNAIDVEVALEIVRLCDEIDSHAGVGAVIIRAEGPAFCSGADRRLLARIASDPTDDANYHDLNTIYASFLRVAALLPPTIALVQGPAVGAGLNLAMSTDVRVVTREARLVSGFLSLGVHPGGGHYTMLSKLLGAEGSAAMGLFGQELTGDEAVRRGLAWNVVPASELEAEGRRLASVPAARPQLSRRAARSFRLQTDAPWLAREVAVQAEQSVQMWSFASGPMASVTSSGAHE